jgi:hypothetical protein
MDTYVAALQEGHTEAAARESAHVQANFDFYDHGWTEMMEFPADELAAHYERYGDFFERHGITIDDPLGEFRSREVSAAPSTPERPDDPERPHAEEASPTTSASRGRTANAASAAEVDPAETPGPDEETVERVNAEGGETAEGSGDRRFSQSRASLTRSSLPSSVTGEP